ncbi:MAG TPA: GGDEF domain-containing protein [Longimicrobiales bacterium]
MLTAEMQPFVSLLGIVLQFAGALLLAVFFRILRPYARRRRYFLTWGWSWTAMALAVGVLAVRFLLQPAPPGVGLPATPATATADFLYQTGKAVHFLLIAMGAAQYAGLYVHPRAPLAVLPVALVFAAVGGFVSGDVNGVLAWQAPLATIALGWSAVRLGSLPQSRHGLGSQVTGAVLSVMAVLWLLYFFAFGIAVRGGVVDGPLFFELIVQFQHYVDLLMAMLLGLGMIVILFEDAKREVDDANAELGVAHSNMRRAALYDTVTGSLNRRAFAEGVGLEMARAGFGAVMMFDLDDLKHINDSYGHSAGDALLRHLTDALRAELRPSDKLYRWGGDEFLLVLQGADEARANARLRHIISKVAVLRLGEEQDEVRLNVSMGSAAYSSAEQLQNAIDAADAMMYREKHRKKQKRAQHPDALKS